MKELITKLVTIVGVETVHQHLMVDFNDEEIKSWKNQIGGVITEDQIDELCEEFPLFYGIYYTLRHLGSAHDAIEVYSHYVEYRRLGRN